MDATWKKWMFAETDIWIFRSDITYKVDCLFFQCDPHELSCFLCFFFSLKILVLAGIKDMKRPVEKVSLFQSLALTGTGEYRGQHDLVTGINTASKYIVSTS